MLLLVLLAALVAGAGGCGDGSSGDTAPAPTAEAPQETADDGEGVEQDLDDFLAACEASTDQWREAEVQAPDSLQVAMGQAVPYRVRADARSPQDRPSAGEGTASSTAMVQCALGARLRSLDDDVVTVVDEGGWTVQRFDDPGTLEWAWAVEGAGPGEAQVVVEFKPAVQTTDGQVVVTSDDASRLLTVSTTVEVTATATQRVGAWFDTGWKVWSAVLAGLGTAVVAALVWGKGLVNAFRDLLASLRREPASGGGSGSAPPSP